MLVLLSSQRAGELAAAVAGEVSSMIRLDSLPS
jgi:hypothetical protein